MHKINFKLKRLQHQISNLRKSAKRETNEERR